MKRTRARRFIKLTIGAELRTQIVTAIKVRRGPRQRQCGFRAGGEASPRHQADQGRDRGHRGYDAEKNHELLRDELHAISIIPARHANVPVWRTRGRYRKEMKRGYSKRHHQRPKDETITRRSSPSSRGRWATRCGRRGQGPRTTR